MIFYDKKNLSLLANMQVTIYETPLARIKKTESLELLLMKNSLSHHMLSSRP